MVVLTFTLNSDESESESIIDYTTLQFNLPADIYFCGILHIGECEEVNPDVFKVMTKIFIFDMLLIRILILYKISIEYYII